MNQLFHRVMSQLGLAMKQLDTNGWAIVAAILMVFGWYFLKGSKIRA